MMSLDNLLDQSQQGLGFINYVDISNPYRESIAMINKEALRYFTEVELLAMKATAEEKAATSFSNSLFYSVVSERILIENINAELAKRVAPKSSQFSRYFGK